jgi:hypothetical protein
MAFPRISREKRTRLEAHATIVFDRVNAIGIMVDECFYPRKSKGERDGTTFLR